MSHVLAFDIYGTLIAPHGIALELEKLIGEQASEFSRRWRDKQLEYTFRRGLMRQYVDFSVCTRQALDYCDTLFGTQLSEADKQHLLQHYARLPAFADVEPGLKSLRRNDIQMVAFSNGITRDVDGLLQQAGIRDFFTDIISVDEIHSYKPDPAVYQHCLSRVGTCAENCWLVSANPFDILGATAINMPTVWVRRDPHIAFDPWESRPTASIEQLTELISVIQNQG
ncbi:haloacid dehalogenase type II [Thiohalophilus sp.]|uniref:haloacid dehalogenase type II n=1 Tax=Thiohalophilus sp. TaxID=3028392 RepID=UPI003974C6D3